MRDGSSARGTYRLPRDQRAAGKSCWRNRQPAAPSGRSGGADVAVAQVRGFLCRELVLGLQLGQAILGIGRHRRVIGRLEVDAIEPSRIAAEDQLLGRAVGDAETRTTVFLLHYIVHLETPLTLVLP